jgi:cysteine sulfinate desulfinase/cysteine desulfurase-like protein
LFQLILLQQVHIPSYTSKLTLLFENSKLQPSFFGGEQEKGLRAGTEALHQIVGMAKALEVSMPT